MEREYEIERAKNLLKIVKETGDENLIAQYQERLDAFFPDKVKPATPKKAKKRG